MYETVSEAVEAFEEMMDETHERVAIGALLWWPSDALKRLDPTAYRGAFLDWADSEGIDIDDLEGEF